MKLRVVNSVSRWDDNGETYLKAFCRDIDNNLHTVDIMGYRPRFYVTEDEYERNQDTLDFDTRIHEIESGYTSIYQEPLVAIKVKESRHLQDLKDMFNSHYRADVWYNDLVRLDLGIKTGIEVPEEAVDGEIHYTEVEPVEFQEPDHRILTVDIETDDRGEFPSHKDPNQRILSVVIHDSFTDSYHGWVDLDGRTIEECFPEAMSTGGAPGCLDSLHCEANEREMLIGVASIISKIDPDILTEWSWNNFDFPYLIARMNEVGANTSRLSRTEGGRVTPSHKGGGPIISGRTINNLLQTYKSTKFSELPSYTLDSVAKRELGEEKIQFDGGFFELYQNDPETFVAYNARDVRLCVDIDREANVLDFKESLQAEEGCRFKTTMNSGYFAQFAVRRRLAKHGLIGPSSGMNRDSHRDYEGAVVLDPYEGVAENVVALDLASLYPNNLAMFNMSPETVVDPDVAEREGIPFVRAPSGVCFRTDREGIVAGMVDEMLELKNGLKQKLKEIPTSAPEYAATEERYNVTKVIVNSLYGIIGWEAFFLYNPDVAEACTLAGQRCIKHTRDWLNQQDDVEVIYGDTDSTYVKLPSNLDPNQCMEFALELEEELNESVYPELASEYGIDSRWEIEAESYSESYFQCGEKKKYAYLLSGEFGENGPELLDEPKLKIKGFQAIKSNFAQHTKDVQRELIESAIHGRSVEHITEVISDGVKYIQGDPDWNRIGMPQKLGQKIDADKSGRDGYYTFTNGSPQGAHPRGAWNANKHAGTHYDEGSKPKRVYVDPRRSVGGIDVIAFEDYADINPMDGDLMMDTDKMVDRLVKKPNESICDALDVDLGAAMGGYIAVGLEAFC